MKPTSYIFLALAAILLFSGWMTCSIAEGMAKSQGIQIFEQKKTKKGDTVYKYEISDEKISNLSLNFSDVDVQIVGSAESSYIELRNFDPYDYATTLSGATVTVDGTVGGLSSLIDMSGGGVRFKGLRYFFADKPDKGHKRSVTVYLSDACDITNFSLKLQEGSVTFKDIYNYTGYNVSVSVGNVLFDTVVTNSVITVSVSAGDLTVANSEFPTLTVNATGGNVAISSTRLSADFIAYNVKTTNSTLIRNEAAIEDTHYRHNVGSSITKSLIKIDATDATVSLIDSASEQETPTE